MQTRPESIWLSGRVFVLYDARLSRRPFFKRRISDRKYGAGTVHSEKGIRKKARMFCRTGGGKDKSGRGVYTRGLTIERYSQSL